MLDLKQKMDRKPNASMICQMNMLSQENLSHAFGVFHRDFKVVYTTRSEAYRLEETMTKIIELKNVSFQFRFLDRTQG